MNKKIYIVTGATSGIGLEAAKSLLKMGNTVILACRNVQKARNLFKDYIKGDGDAHVIQLDLASFDSINAFTKEFLSRFDRLDVLINNAGIICDKHQKTSDGFEMTMGVNYLGTYHLTEQLLNVIKSTQNSRIVNVASIVGIKSSMQEEVLDFYNLQHGLYAYTASKLALILYTQHLAKKLSAHAVTANCVHPGVIGSNIWSGESILMKLTNPLMRFFFPHPRFGAKSLIYLAHSDEVKDISGAVFNKKKIATIKHERDELMQKLINETEKAISNKL